MSLSNKHLTNDIQHNPPSFSSQSLMSLPPSHHDGDQHDKGSSHSSDPSFDQRQRNQDLERQSIAPISRSSSSNSLYRHGRSSSDGKHKKSAHTQTQTLQHSFEDLDRLQAEKQQQHQQQLGLKAVGDGLSIDSSSFSKHSPTQCRPPPSPSTASSHNITLSDGSHPSDHHQLLYDTGGYYSSLAPPYAECPLVTDDLHLPVPTTIHHYLIYDDYDYNDTGDKENNNGNKLFETMVSQLCPYPFRSRAPLGDRLKRKPPPAEQRDHDMDAAKRYPSLLDQQREKRHSLGNGQIDRLVHGRKSLLAEYDLSDLLFEPNALDPSPTHSTSSVASALGYPSPPSSSSQEQQQQQIRNQNNDLLLEDRIHWLTQGYYLIPTSQNATPSPPGGHDPPPSLFSSPPPSSPLI